MRTGQLLQAGVVPYARAYEWMHELAARRAEGEIPDTLLLLEHPPTYTAGRRSDPAHLVWTRQQMESLGAELHEGCRIVDCGVKPNVIRHLRMLEEVVIRAARDVGVDLERDTERTGVWAGDRKACAIGVKLERARVTLHGFALNCTTDLKWFDAIVPCGLADRGVTTMTQLAGREVTVEEMTPLVIKHFQDVFDVSLERAFEPIVAASS